MLDRDCAETRESTQVLLEGPLTSLWNKRYKGYNEDHVQNNLHLRY